MPLLSRRLRGLLVLAPLSVSSAALFAADADAIYSALRSARPEGSAVAVRAMTLERDVFRFRFDSGAFQFLRAVAGRRFGAVFVGQGTVELSPASEAERRQLALETGDKALEVFAERFEEAVLLFTDDTAAEIERAGTAGVAPARAAAAYDGFFDKQRKRLKTNLHLRLVEKATRGEGPADPLFLTYFVGKKTPPAIAVVDPGGLDWLSPEFGGEESALYVIDESEGGFWYLAPEKRGTTGASASRAPDARATRYRIETTIAKNEAIRGTTTLRIELAARERRVLPIHLEPKLRIQSVSFSGSDEGPWTPAGFVQENEKEDADAAVLFPAPVSRAQPLLVRVLYEGKDVLRNAGDGNFVVGARESWYPNVGVFRDPAAFELIYRYPKAYQVVSVGNPLEERVEGDNRVAIWKTERPIRVAGFNYGKFKKLQRKDPDSGFEVSVYTNTGTPDVIREMNLLLEARPRGAGLQSVRVDPDALADSAMADGINTARVGSVYFGPLPERRVSITQQTQAFFGQSWPSLIYLPYIAGAGRHDPP